MSQHGNGVGAEETGSAGRRAEAEGRGVREETGSRSIRGDWTLERASAHYNIPGWSAGFFSVNAKGHLCVLPHGPQSPDSPGPSIDIMDIVEDIQERKLGLPLCGSLSGHSPRAGEDPQRDLPQRHPRAAATAGSTSASTPSRSTRCARWSRRSLDAGAPFHYGLEAGSKGELLVVLALNSDPEALTVCNGYKDEEYLRLALLGPQARPQGHRGDREALRAAAPDRNSPTR